MQEEACVTLKEAPIDDPLSDVENRQIEVIEEISVKSEEIEPEIVRIKRKRKQTFKARAADNENGGIGLDEVNRECDLCERKFDTLRGLSAHQRTHKNEFPSLKKSKRSRVAPHTHRKDSDVELKCNMCTFTCFNLWTFHCHLKRHKTAQTELAVDEGAQKSQCVTCGASFLSKFMATHMALVHPKEKFEREEKEVEVGEDVKAVRKDVPPGVCDICGKNFKSNALETHRLSHFTATNKKIKHKCIICNYAAFDKQKVFKHMKDHEKEYIRMLAAGESMVKCEVCHALFNNKKILKNHLEEHLKKPKEKWPCSGCRHRFNLAVQLRNHIKAKHSQFSEFHLVKLEKEAERRRAEEKSQKMIAERNQKAEIVREQLAMLKAESAEGDVDEEGFELLEETSKKKVPPGVCDICGKNCKTEQSLETHRITHVKSKIEKRRVKHSCKICSFTTFTRSTLLKHMKLHDKQSLSASGEVFQCDVCFATSKDEKSLRAHLENHLTKKEKFKCSGCSRVFLLKRLLERHIKEKHLEFVEFHLEVLEKEEKKRLEIERNPSMLAEKKAKLHTALNQIERLQRSSNLPTRLKNEERKKLAGAIRSIERIEKEQKKVQAEMLTARILKASKKAEGERKKKKKKRSKKRIMKDKSEIEVTEEAIDGEVSHENSGVLMEVPVEIKEEPEIDITDTVIKFES